MVDPHGVCVLRRHHQQCGSQRRALIRLGRLLRARTHGAGRRHGTQPVLIQLQAPERRLPRRMAKAGGFLPARKTADPSLADLDAEIGV